MKCLIAKVSALFFMIPTIAMAGWQVARPESAVIPSDPFFQGSSRQDGNLTVVGGSGGAFPNQFATLGQPAAVFAVSLSGSLKENIERIMDRYHWRVVWKAPYDYNFDGRVTGASLPNVIQKILTPFPLQAVLYMSNRTMAVFPRNPDA